jgi:hypothetical protein
MNMWERVEELLFGCWVVENFENTFGTLLDKNVTDMINAEAVRSGNCWNTVGQG